MTKRRDTNDFSLNRRQFLWSGSALAAALPLWPLRVSGAVFAHPTFRDYPFQLGVASGDPAEDGVVLWTRLAPDPFDRAGVPAVPIEVAWEVCADEAMTRVVRKGTAIATPELAHSVHVEVDGLQPERWYWYRFKAGNEVSPVGRTKTAPAAGSLPDAVRFAYASCQHFESGLYTAYEHMAKEDLDLVLHLGDYIYEGAARENQVRKHVGQELYSLEDYRNRHAQYKTDQHLQATHAAFPWVVTWDDHEFDNNCAGAISEEPNVGVEEYLKRRAFAYQAYYEHMPLRASSRPVGPDMRLYRRIPFGRLIQFDVLDTRQYRTDQPCGDHNKPQCPEAFDPRATMLGAEQEHWLAEGLKVSPATWNVLAQQVMIARVDRKPGEEVAYSMDQWPGYEAARLRLLNFLHEQRISNPVAIAGDIHTNWANNLQLDCDDEQSPVVATEFVGTSITSGGDGSQTKKDTQGVLDENPFVKFYNAERGYVRCEVTPQRWQTDYQVVEYISRPGAPLITRASFVVEEGRPGVQQA